MVKVKVCCISSPREARLAVRYGADALGVVGPMPSGPGTLTNDQINAITPHIPPSVASFLLTSETSPDAIVQHHQRAPASTLQLVDALQGNAYTTLRAALPGINIVQVVHIRGEASVDEALRLSHSVDMLLLDSGNPALPVKQLGGTGRTHNWQLSRRIVAQSAVPVFLAGGLTPQNVQQAITEVQPYGVDVCSGLRSDGRLDEQKLAAFFRAIS